MINYALKVCMHNLVHISKSTLTNYDTIFFNNLMIIKHDKTITLICKRIAKIVMVNGRELIRVKRANKQEANIHLIDVNEDI